MEMDMINKESEHTTRCRKVPLDKVIKKEIKEMMEEDSSYSKAE